MEGNIKRFTRIYPWFSGLTGDLLFYIAIDTLFLTLVKHFSAAQIVSLTSLSQLACIALQFPLLFVIKKIGNTASIRLGALLLLLSAVFITLGQSYYVVLLGRILHDAAAIFRTAAVVALENNLEALDRRKDFVRYRTAANTVYSFITMLISFVASYLFNLNPYVPMLCCIGTCTAGLVLSLLMKDCSGYDKIFVRKTNRARVKIPYGSFIVITILVYSIFCLVVTNSQNEGKLFIQQQLLLEFDAETTALLIGAVVCVSRIVRVCSNVVFARLYEKYQGKMGIALPVMLSFSIVFLLLGSAIPTAVAKIIVMSLGYSIILFVRDPFKLYIQDVVLGNTPKEQHQTLLTVLEFGVKIAGAGMGLVFSAILVGYPMAVVMWLLLGISAVEIALSLKLYKAVLTGKSQKTAER